MNPLTITKNISKYSERELEKGGKSSWHDQYKDSAWIFIGGLSYDLSEGDVIAIFSQYGEIVNINLVRDKFTGKSKGFCFLCYEDQRSTILAVDNFNGIKVLKRTIRVDHVSDYKMPKESEKIPTDEETRRLHLEGCAPKSQKDIKKEKKSEEDDKVVIEPIISIIKKEEKSPIKDIDTKNKTEKSHKRKSKDNDERKSSTKKHKSNKEKSKKKESSSDTSSPSPIKSKIKEKRPNKKKHKKEKKTKKKKREKSTSSSSTESSDESVVISKKESKHKHRKH